MINRTIIIAEAGVNHNGSIGTAKELVKKAAECGADYVKFQTFITEDSISKNAKKAKYQINNSKNKNESQFDMVKKLELSKKDHYILIKECEKHSIKFLSTAFDMNSIDLISDLNLDFFKIPSGEIDNFPYLLKVANKFQNIILSTGMATIEEIEWAYNILISNGKKKSITILHCNTEYPTPLTDVNLKAINHIKSKLNVDIGYSDHTLGIEVPIGAVTMGAKIIEKHFTLDNSMDGPDHKASLDPIHFKKMVDSIRNIELAISGSETKSPSDSEKKNIKIVRKSIYLNKNLNKNDLILEEDLITLRPQNGIKASEWLNVIGKKINKDKYKGDCLKIEDIN